MQQVRVIKTPAFAEIPKETVAQQESDGPFRVLSGRAEQIGLLKILAADQRVIFVELEGPEDRVRQSPHIQFPRILLQGSQQARTENEQKHEVVKMTRLKRGILTIVRKPKKLPGIIRGTFGQRCGKVLTQDAKRKHGGGRGTALPGKAGQSIDVTPLSGVFESTVQAKTELTGNEPEIPPGSTLSLFIDLMAFRNLAFEGGFHPKGYSVMIHPGVRQILNAALVFHLRANGGKKSKSTFTIGHPKVINLAGGEAILRFVVLPHRVVFLPALPAEVGAIKEHPIHLPAGGKALGIQGDLPDVVLIQGAVNLAWSADPLVQFKSENGAAIPRLDLLGLHQEGLQRLAGDRSFD